jgi:eukaryotic-like serine/threonine-protein kinase
MASKGTPSLKGDKVSVNPDTATTTGGGAEHVAARFSVKQLLGEGGMGSVFVAQDRGLGRVVALKRLRDGLEKDRGALRRFVLEAQIGAQLEHPNIVPLYSFERSETGLPAIAMQLLEGMTMADYIRAAAAAPKAARAMRGEYSLKERIGTLLGACEAIHFAHERGVIHRDLKPDNVMLGRYREVYVMDWGLARVTGSSVDLRSSLREERTASLGQAELETSATLAAAPGTEIGTPDTVAQSGSHDPARDAATATRQGDVMGTPQYMPPEQALGLIDQVGAAADQYALGVMLQELATLKPARSHKSTMAALTEALENKLAPPVDVDGDEIHPALRAIVACATQKEPGDRYPTVAALSADIRRFVRDEPVSVYPEGIARRLVRAAGRRPVLAMGILSVCGFLTSVAVVGAVVRDAVQVKRQARTLENTRRVLVAVAGRAQAIDVKLSDLAASVQAIGAAATELVERDTATIEPVRATTPPLAPSAVVGGAAASFDAMVQSWPGKADGAEPPASAKKLPRIEHWFRKALVDALPPAERAAGALAQNTALGAGRGALVRAFVGLEDGAYAQYPARVVAATYDPRSRPWYRMAKMEEALHWTRPFADVAGKTLRMSAVMGMRSQGAFIGAAGCDLRVASLVPDLALDLPGFRRAFLVSEDGRIAASAELEDVVLAKVTNVDAALELPSVENPELARRIARREPGGYVAAGDAIFVYARLISPPWTYVAELEKKRYLED